MGREGICDSPDLDFLLFGLDTELPVGSGMGNWLGLLPEFYMSTCWFG